jgi:hypothetical protein
MNKTFRTSLVALALLGSASSAFAAPVPAKQRTVNDPWVQQIHLDSTAVPAAQFFQELQHDGE